MMRETATPILSSHQKNYLIDATRLLHPSWKVCFETRTHYCHVIIAQCPHCALYHVVSTGLGWEETLSVDPTKFADMVEMATAISQSLMYHYSKNIAEEKAGLHGYEPTIN